MITLSDSLNGEQTGDALILVGDERVVEAVYYKNPETGDVELGVDDLDEVPINKPVKITLHDHDSEGSHSEYNGKFNEQRVFA